MTLNFDDRSQVPETLKAARTDRTFTTDALVMSLSQMQKEAQVQGHTVLCDEGQHLGGSGTAPSPIGYLLSCIGFCLLTQLSRYAYMRKTTFRDARVRVVGTFKQEGSAVAGTVRAECLGIETHLEIESDDDATKIENLVSVAEAGCFVMQTIMNQVPVSKSVKITA